MRVELLLALKDVPGMLVKALEPVSANGGNIINVVHSRVRGKAQVTVTFFVRDQVTLNSILKALAARKIEYDDVRLEGRRYYSKRSLSFVLVGHVVDRDIQDTIDRINRVGLVRDVDIRMAGPQEESAVLMRVNVDEDRLGRLNDCVKDVCHRKKFLLIGEVGL
jgi:ACT domain-containing protein